MPPSSTRSDVPERASRARTHTLHSTLPNNTQLVALAPVYAAHHASPRLTNKSHIIAYAAGGEGQGAYQMTTLYRICDRTDK